MDTFLKNKPGFEIDASRKIVYNDNLSPPQSYGGWKYSGQVDSSGVAHGVGRATCSDAISEGIWINGKFTGR